jgi:hypothetical protein
MFSSAGRRAFRKTDGRESAEEKMRDTMSHGFFGGRKLSQGLQARNPGFFLLHDQKSALNGRFFGQVTR